MRRESHVRFCEGPGVQFPRSTRLIVGFQHRADARRFLAELHDRLGNFGLELHPDKTRLLSFGRFSAERRAKVGMGKPETFNFLGFTHICGKSEKGDFLLVRHTMRKRLAAKLQEVKAELRRRWHQPIAEQGEWLGSVVRGHNAYYGVPTNVHALQSFRTQVERHWLWALKRRSQRDKTTWEDMRKLSARWIPVPRIQHPWPTERFDAKTRGRSPVR